MAATEEVGPAAGAWGMGVSRFQASNEKWQHAGAGSSSDYGLLRTEARDLDCALTELSARGVHALWQRQQLTSAGEGWAGVEAGAARAAEG